MPKNARKAPVKLLEDQYPTHYLPHVGRQVMQDGGTPIESLPDFARMDMEQKAIDRAAEAMSAQRAEQPARRVEAELRPGPEQSFWEKTRDKLLGLDYGRPSPERRQFVEGLGHAIDAAHMAAYAAPATRAPVAVADFASSMAQGSPIEGALAASFLPGGKYARMAGAALASQADPEAAQASFFGELAKMTPEARRALELARGAIAKGAKPAETWAEHGWGTDPSGAMVSEVSDLTARLRPEGLSRFRAGEDVTMGDILSHPDLYDLYPSSYSTRVSPLHRPINERGFYNHLLDYAGTNMRLSDRDILENLLHEHTHRMQNIEGLSPGTDPKVLMGPEGYAQTLEEELQSHASANKLRELMEKYPSVKGDPIGAKVLATNLGIKLGGQPTRFMHLSPEAAEERMQSLKADIEQIYQNVPSAQDQYLRHLGELTARLPGERLEMTGAQRRAAFPYDPNYPVIIKAPNKDRIPNQRNLAWEKDRERAIDIARELQKQSLPVKPIDEVSQAEEDLMRAAMEAEAAKRGRAEGGAVKDREGMAGGGKMAGVEAALRLLGKLRPEGSGYVPREGFPGVVNLPGIGRVEPRPIEPIEAISRRFAGSAHDAPVAPINPEFSERVAREYEGMRHAPSDPVVKRAFQALADETMAQYRAAKDLGLDIRFLKPGQADPYAASPALGYEDIVNRGRLFVFPTEQGFGSTGGLNATNVLLKGAGQVGDKPDAVVNDAFRVIHDLYGHFGPGNPFFRAPGEERAYQLHRRMFSPEAVPALASETRGQNSWVNFGPMAARNKAASGAETYYADQKTGLMPEWATEEPPPVGFDIEQLIRGRRADGGKVGLIEAAAKAVAPYVDRTLLPHRDVIKRIPELEEAMKAGVRGAEYQALVDRFKPVKEWADVPEPATMEQILGALRPGQRRRVGAGENIEAGRPVGLRLDIPAYAGHGVWVPTIHEAGAKGRPIAHEATARVSDATLGFRPGDAMSVAMGGAKFPFAKIEGSWMPSTDRQTFEAAKEYLRHKDWRQIGMDPERHAYFYDRASQEPIVGAEEVMQVGPLVLGKNPLYGKRGDFEYAAGGRAGMQVGGIAEALKVVAPYARRAVSEIPYTERMFATHNIQPRQLKMASEEGALAAPSIGISKPTSEALSQFGDVALVAHPHVVEPAAETHVFGQDVWTPRYPVTRVYDKSMFRRDDPHAFEGRGFFSIPLGRPVPATVKNAVEEMKSRPIIGGEYLTSKTSDLEPDLGYLTSILAPKFKAFEEIQGARGRLVPEAQYNKSVEAARKEHEDLAYILGRDRPMDVATQDVEDQDYFGNMILRAIQRRRAADPAQGGLPFFSTIKSHYPSASPLQVERVAEHVKNIAGLPAKYFEAKPMRPVNLREEFAGAVIPEAQKSELAPLLKQMGIGKIETYDPIRGGAGVTMMEHFPEAAFASGGVVPRADDEQFFRRLALWTYAVAPMFAGPNIVRRNGYAGGGGAGKLIEQAVRAAKVITSKGEPTVKGMVREAPLYPDVYKNPRLLAEEAEARVAPEDPLLKQLWGVNREDMFNIAGNRPGNREPVLAAPAERTRGINYASEGVMTPENAARLQNILEEGQRQPGLRTGMMPWYYMDPVYNRLEDMFGPEEAANRYKLLNTSMSMMSPASSVPAEINRGLGAYHLALQGRADDFILGGGKPSAAPQGVLPPYMRDRMLGHKVHSTSQAGPWSRYIETGDVEMGSPKVPLYIQSSGVPATGFQTKLPVPDAHYTRILGMPDVRRTSTPEVSMKMGEYRPVGPWFREDVAKPMEMEAVPAQALLWGTGSGATGVDSPIGAPKLEMLSQHIGNVAKHYRISPETARDLLLQGTLYSSGGSVIDRALDVVSNIPRHQVEPGTPG